MLQYIKMLSSERTIVLFMIVTQKITLFNITDYPWQLTYM
ncbi:hypothetical protein YpAngola_B0022 (plasmid) [Yersinia pestis Angola]|nr:hypothetical protein YpAngola_B0022 [Yersinia pestis Angola]